MSFLNVLESLRKAALGQRGSKSTVLVPLNDLREMLRDWERLYSEVRAKASQQVQGDARAACDAYIDSLGGAESDAWHGAPVDGVFIAGFEAGRKAMPTPKQEPAGAVPDEPKNPGAAYLQTFLNDSRFDVAVNSMPDSLIEKFHSRIVERTADRDDWKLYANNLEEDIAKLQSLRITEQDAREIVCDYENWRLSCRYIGDGFDAWTQYLFYSGAALLDKLNANAVADAGGAS